MSSLFACLVPGLVVNPTWNNGKLASFTNGDDVLPTLMGIARVEASDFLLESDFLVQMVSHCNSGTKTLAKLASGSKTKFSMAIPLSPSKKKALGKFIAELHPMLYNLYIHISCKQRKRRIEKRFRRLPSLRRHFINLLWSTLAIAQLQGDGWCSGEVFKPPKTNGFCWRARYYRNQ